MKTVPQTREQSGPVWDFSDPYEGPVTLSVSYDEDGVQLRMFRGNVMVRVLDMAVEDLVWFVDQHGDEIFGSSR